MMVGAVHGGTHQVYRTGVYTHILFMGMLLMDGLCNQTAIGAQHKTAQLCAQRYITHTRRHQNLLIDLPHPFADGADIIRLLIRTVRDADTSGKIDKGNMSPRFLMEADCQLKQDLCQHGVILICHRVACQKGMNAEILCSLGF